MHTLSTVIERGHAYQRLHTFCPNLADYASKLYKHPLVSTMATGKKLPSYIGSGTFASALVDLLAHGEEDQPTVEIEDKAAQVVHNASGDPVQVPGLSPRLIPGGLGGRRPVRA